MSNFNFKNHFMNLLVYTVLKRIDWIHLSLWKPKGTHINMYFLFSCSQRTIWSSQIFPPTMKTLLPVSGCVRTVGLFLCFSQTVLAMVITNSTGLESILDNYRDKDEEWWRVRSRGKRAISEGDMHLILDLHNKLRGQVHPPASNMEYMVTCT